MEVLRQRRPAPADATWELHAEGYRGNSHWEEFALVWMLMFIFGLAALAPLPLRGIPLPIACWAILLLACTASGVMAALLARRRNRYRLFLSAQGIQVQARGKSTDFLNWNEITRLDWQPASEPRHLTIRSGERHIEFDCALADWEAVTAIVRQHSPIVTPPSTKQCQRRSRTPR